MDQGGSERNPYADGEKEVASHGMLWWSENATKGEGSCIEQCCTENIEYKQRIMQHGCTSVVIELCTYRPQGSRPTMFDQRKFDR